MSSREGRVMAPVFFKLALPSKKSTNNLIGISPMGDVECEMPYDRENGSVHIPNQHPHICIQIRTHTNHVLRLSAATLKHQTGPPTFEVLQAGQVE